jgi:hypothetical protein
MAIEPKNTREHILSLYGHISGVKKKFKTRARRRRKVGR